MKVWDMLFSMFSTNNTRTIINIIMNLEKNKTNIRSE